MKTKILLLILFCLSINQIKSQTFEIPKNVVLSAKEDYAKYEKEIIACVNWLENSPLDKDVSKRKEANVFFMKWLTGSPTVSINLNADYIIKYTEKNPDLLLIFMAGWTRYSLENNYSNDQMKGYYEGFKSMISVYKRGIGIQKEKNMEKLIKIYDEGQLEDWITKNLKK
ncbi:hypothetical protein [Paludibacter jiangxiensis]|uniref:Uncharacterized protein n=1 Tax=Paludibacter jiangxiensis TaxID=681398 RepID=A0A170YKB4_9BACT|nr:hypothetical protein [Paludibacter jiangxiensis]GAT61871.1 hypothetical protein PJIAN_1458 [Paludibacter jiangxiensis]